VTTEAKITVTPTDRTGWRSGPWDGEPDRAEWRDEATELPCLAKRSRLGSWCGYVAVPPGHPWHGVDYDDLEGTEVHGGLTFAGECSPEHGICHVPAEGESADVWWLGFDCAHAWDLVPGLETMLDQVDDRLHSRGVWSDYREINIYRDLDYVKAECAQLAAQVATAT
jgi:hypothetical protein